MIDAATWMQWAGCGLGVAGSIALARNDRYSGWGFVAYLASSAAWLGYGVATGVHALVIQHLVFTAISAFGVWRWLVLPRSKAGPLRFAQGLSPAAGAAVSRKRPTF